MNFIKSIFGFVTITGANNQPESKFVAGVAVARVAYMGVGFLLAYKVDPVRAWINKINFLNKEKLEISA